MAKFYKVYEIEDNVEYKSDNYLTHFVGAFKDKNKAESLCICIEVANCNSTKIEFGEITIEDAKDVVEYGLNSIDFDTMVELDKLIKQNNLRNKKPDLLTK